MFLLHSIYTYFNNRNKLSCVVEDDTDQTNFLMIGKGGESFLGISYYRLVVKQGYDNASTLPQS